MGMLKDHFYSFYVYSFEINTVIFFFFGSIASGMWLLNCTSNFSFSYEKVEGYLKKNPRRMHVNNCFFYSVQINSFLKNEDQNDNFNKFS